MRAILILNGTVPSTEDFAIIEEDDLVACADGAADACMKVGVVPQLLIGDLDSIGTETFRWAEAESVEVIEHPSCKDETDGELALQKLQERGISELIILGGHGGRTAMFLSNLHLLQTAVQSGIAAQMRGSGEVIHILPAGSQMELAPRPGATLNLIALQGTARVDLLGAGWGGDDIVLEPMGGRGCSNPLGEDEVHIDVHEGLVLLIIEQAIA